MTPSVEKVDILTDSQIAAIIFMCMPETKRERVAH
jgi:hypothetical protein